MTRAPFLRAWWIPACALLASLAGCASPVVGAECRSGLELCDGVCVDLDRDPRHCGACGRACASGQSCDLGTCIGPWGDGGAPEAGLGEAGVADAGPDAGRVDVDASNGWPDGGASDGGIPDGAPADGGGPPVCDVGELLCGDACVRPDSDPSSCGGCGVVCAADEVCAGGVCAAECGPPRGVCDGLCVDLRNDPDHCGACGVRCPSGVCVAGRCSGPLAGHLVVVGHDYQQSRTDMNRIAGNSVFLGRGTPVRVLVYEGEARADAVAGVDAAVAQVSAAIGRTWTRTVAATPDEVPLALADADVFVVYAQSDTPDGVLADLGEAWARALRTFLSRGGVVVLFDGMGANSGTHVILTYAGLFSSTGRTDATDRILDVAMPGDAVALGMPLRYRGERSSVRFETTEGVVVVSDGRGPVVVHRTVRP